MHDTQFIDRILRLEQRLQASEAALAKVTEVVDHQSNPYVHGLTCGVDSEHPLLMPRWDAESRRLSLRCTRCGYDQSGIPETLMPDATPFALALAKLRAGPGDDTETDPDTDVGC